MNVKSILFFALTLMSDLVMAESAAQKLAALTSTVQSFQASFSQTVMAGGRNTNAQNSEGLFLLQRPGKFRWETQKPFKQLLVSGGKEMWIYEPDIDSATVQTLEEGLGSTPALLLASTAQQLLDSFDISEIGQQHFKLLPKTAGGNFDEVQLIFNGKQLKELLLADALGTKTRVVFGQAKMNEKMTDDKFMFKPGPEVDVIDNRHSGQ